MAVWTTGWEEPKYEGCVLNWFERNGYEDSDWYAECWDREKQKIVQIEYDTTRYGCSGYAKIDATDEVLREVYRMYRNMGRELFDTRTNEKQAKEFDKGDMVIVVRGRKVKPGTVGKVFWIGTRFNQYSYQTEERVGIEVDGERLFLPKEYCENADWQNRLLTGKARKQKIRNFAIHSMPRHYRHLFDPSEWLWAKAFNKPLRYVS